MTATTGTKKANPDGLEEAIERRPLVVVGVDGSKPSSAALSWAAQEARLRKSNLKVVLAYHFPVVAPVGYIPADAFATTGEEAARELDRQVDETLGPHPDIPVEPVVAQGPPALVILEAAKEADLVVVGSRGRGGFSGFLLGSVSSQVVHHARCPVTIVPA